MMLRETKSEHAGEAMEAGKTSSLHHAEMEELREQSHGAETKRDERCC